MQSILRARGHARLLGFGVVCVAAAAIAGPGVAAAAKDTVMSVFIANTEKDPVPVTAQGTTQVAGTVTVANQPQPAARRQRIQQNVSLSVHANADRPSAIVYEVPEGKNFVLEYGQLWFTKTGKARSLNFTATCGAPLEGDIELATYQLPELPSTAEIFTIHGGAVNLVVPGGGCVRLSTLFDVSELPPGFSFIVSGGISGYLEDAS